MVVVRGGVGVGIRVRKNFKIKMYCLHTTNATLCKLMQLKRQILNIYDIKLSSKLFFCHGFINVHIYLYIYSAKFLLQAWNKIHGDPRTCKIRSRIS